MNNTLQNEVPSVIYFLRRKQVEEKLDNIVCNFLAYASMLWYGCRKHPLVVLIFMLLAYCGACVYVLASSSENYRSFISESMWSVILVAVVLIIFHPEAEKNRPRPDILSTEPTWFDEPELR
jgi:hypothetical protein